MWLQLAIAFVSFIVMNFLAPKPQIENARASKLSDFKFPRSKEGDPVAVIYGTVKLDSPNTLWTGGFRTKPITQYVSTGMFGGTHQTIGFKYRIGFDLALCLGPNVTLKRVWAGTKELWSGSVSTESRFSIGDDDLFGGDKNGGGFSGEIFFYPGNAVQSQNAYVIATENDNPNIPAYVGISHITFEDFYIGTSPQLQPISVEAQCMTNTLGILSGQNVMPNGFDLNLMEILFDLIVTKWGKLGVSIDNIGIDNLRAAAAVLYAEGNGGSLKIENSNSGKDVIEELLRQADGILYQDPQTGQILIKLVRNDYVVGTLPIVDQSNNLNIADYKKNLWSDTYNQVRINYINRANKYADASMPAQDLANINFQQRVRNSDISMPACYDSDLAPKLASRSLAQLSVPLFQCELTVNRTMQGLRPGSVINLSLPEYGISQLIMRVRQMDFGELVNGTIKLVVSQDIFGTDKTIFMPSQPTSWTPPDNTPKVVLNYLMQAAPYWMQAHIPTPVPDTQALILALAAAPGNASVGYALDTSLAPWTSVTGTIAATPYAGSAKLVAAYPATVGSAGLDAVGFNVYGADSFDNAVNATAALIQSSGNNLLMVDDEIMAFQTFINNGNGTYSFKNIQRGLFDTAVAAHTIDARMFLIDGLSSLGASRYAAAQAAITGRFLDLTTAASLDPTLATNVVTSVDSRPQRPLPNVVVTVNGSQTPAPIIGPSSYTVAWKRRNRLDDTIRFLSDADVAPEASQTTTLRYRFNAGAWTTLPGITGTSSVVTPGSVPTVLSLMDIEVWSVRAALASRVTYTVSFQVQAVALPVITTAAGSIFQTNPLIVGTAQPGAVVQVAVDAVNWPTTATADGGGNWSIRVSGLTEAAHNITARATLGTVTSAFTAATVLTVTWYDPAAYLFIDFANARYRRNGVVTTNLTSLFNTITTSTQIARGSDSKYRKIAANDIPVAIGFGTETWAASTNNLTHFNAAPVALTNMTKSGNATATLALLADSAALSTGDLLPLVTDGTLNANVFDLNNTLGGSGDAVATSGGQVGALVPKTASVFALVTGGSALLQIGGVTVATIPAGTQYVRFSGQRTPAVITELWSIVAPIGVRVRFILGGLETSAFATSPIVIAGAAAGRVAPTIKAALTAADVGISAGVVSVSMRAFQEAANAVVFMMNMPDASNRLYMQYLTPNLMRSNYQVAGVSTGQLDRSGFVQNAWSTAVYGYAAANFAQSEDGSAVITRLTGTVLASSATYDYSLFGGTGAWQGYIKYMSFNSTRLPNAELVERSQWQTVL